MIIDFHMHLGDILHKDGAKTIYAQKKMPRKFNIQRFEEKILHFNTSQITNWLLAKYDDQYTKSVQERLQAATAENYCHYLDRLKKLSAQLFQDEEVRCICMPISPYVNFDDVYAFSKQEKSIEPFTSILPHVSESDMLKDLNRTLPLAKGLKLHPIIQGIPFDSRATFEALKLVSFHKKVVLLHAGASRYYLDGERHLQHCELDDPREAEKMIRYFPEIIFVVGHAGIYEFDIWASLLAKYENVFVDLSVQSSKSITNIINLYGIDRVLYASDWPCVDPNITKQIMLKTFKDEQLEKVFYKNALNILTC